MSTPHEQIRQIVNTALLRSDFTLVNRLLAERPNAIVIDIGTSVGGFVAHWIGQGAAEVHCFEPVPAAFHALRGLWSVDPRVKLNNLAVGDETRLMRGVRVMNAHSLGDPAKVKLDIALEDTGAFNMQIVTLDEHLIKNKIRDVDFIKLDVDGHEKKALDGMQKTFKRLRPVMMIELSYLPRAFGDSCEAIVDWFYNQDYKLCTMSGEVCEDPLFVLEAFPWRTSFDMVAVPNERIQSSWPRVR